MINILDLQK